MKLLICATEYFPYGSGIANVVYNLVEQLEKQGVECTVCSPSGPDIKLGSKKLINTFGFLGLVYYWCQVSYYFKKNEYDIVWLHNPYFICHNPFSSYLVTMHSTYYGMSLYHVGNTWFLRIYNKIISKFEKFCIAHLSKKTLFTGVGQPVCEELEKLGIEKERIFYIPNAVDIQHFKPIIDKKSLRKNFKIPENDIILLSVGRLTHAKQPHDLIKVFSLLEKKCPNLTLCIAGTGELLDPIKKMVDEAGLKKVMFLGHVDYNSKLPDLYAASDYFIITSIYEGGMPPLALSEAMASGLPCIVSNIPSLGSVERASCGIIINFGDINDASYKILDYIKMNHPDHSINAREFVINNLDETHIASLYLKLLLPPKTL